VENTQNKTKLEQVQQEKVNIAFFGPPGSGKSSLINAICGAQVVEVGVQTDTTQEAKIVEHGELNLVDLPGYGTSRFPQHTFFASFNPLQYELFVCVFAGKLQQADTEFFHQVTALGKPCIFVRNKTDEIYEEDKTLAQSQELIRQDVAKQLATADFTLVFVSARADLQQGIGELNNCLASKLDAARREKYIMAAKAYTKKQLEQKKTVALKYVKQASHLAALNGLNPVLGVDAAVDLAILHKMYGAIRTCFAITASAVEDSTLTVGTKSFILKGMSREGIRLILTTVGKKLAAKTVLKYIPLVGQAAASYIGYSLAKKAGTDYVEACYQVAEEQMYKTLDVKK